MKTRQIVALGGLLIVGALGACSTQEPPPAPTSSVPPALAATASTTSSPPVSSGDLAACSTYLAIQDQANDQLKIVTAKGTSTFIISAMFERIVTALERPALTAQDPRLVKAIQGALSGAKAAQATTDAWREGDNLNLSPDLQVLYDSTNDVVTYCTEVGQPGAYVPLMPPQ